MMDKPVVWIIGASSGIGRELALGYRRDGWIVAATARPSARLDALAAQTPGIHAFAADILDRDGLAGTFAAIETALGLPDLVIVNAGTHAPTPAADFDAERANRIIAINLNGAVNAAGVVLPRFVQEGRGHVVLVASVAGYRGLPFAAAYSASKAGVIALAEAFRPELDRAGVTIQVVTPGFVRTPLTDRNDFPMPFIIEADDAARRIMRGIRGRGFEITFPKRFTWWLKVMRILPYPLYFAITRRMLRK
ncbi:MAG: SDR family NAD(P)-dependent oxidoreductase [Sphingomonadales bacterium]